MFMAAMDECSSFYQKLYIVNAEVDEMPKSKILLVDDEPDIVETAAFMLQARNYSVVTASGGLECIEKAGNEHPD